MAEFITPEEFEKTLARQKELYEAGYITAKEYETAQKDAATGVRNYTANLKNSMSQLGTSFKALGKDIYSGKQGVGVFNDTLGSGANAIATYATKFGPAGIALGKFTQAVTAFVTASLKQSDALFDSYQKISRTGTVGAGAMTEVFDNMLKFGYTVDQLGNLGDLLARNSKNFGLFFQSALSGARSFGNIATELQNSPIREQFFRLGMSVDDINDGVAGYVVQQGKLGQIQGKTVDQLAKGAAAYIKELDVLTKLTGMSRQEQEDAREGALQIEAFYAGLADLGEKEQEQAMQAYTMAYAKGGPKAAAEMAATFNGVITAGSDMFLATGGASMQAFNKEFFAKGGTAAQSYQMVKDSITPAMMDVVKSVQQVGGAFGPPLRTLKMLTSDGLDPMGKRMAELAEEQKGQIAGVDSATKSQAKARDSQIKMAQNMQEFVNLGVNPATQALEFFTEVLENLTSFIPGAGRAKARREDAAATRAGTTTARQDAVSSTTGSSTDVGSTYGQGAQLTPAEAMSGLRVKSAEAYAGGNTPEQLVAIAHSIQQKVGGDLKYFSAFNDTYDRGGNSLHGKGRALDFTLNDPQNAAAVADMIRSIPGITKVIDEYANPSKSATGGHIHAEISAANGAILSGPTSGYKPNLTMHGTEAVIPLNTPAGQAAIGGQDNSIMAAQLDRLDELVSVMKSQLSVSTKIMQYSS
jgi:hypothetical protein